MSARNFAPVVGMLLVYQLVGCGPSRNENEPRAVASLSVTMATPQQTEVQQSLQLSGTITPWQEMSIGAELNGVRLADVLVDVGDQVRAGQVLAKFDDRTLLAQGREANAGVKQAQASLDLARSNASRGDRLVATGLVSASNVEQLRADVVRAEAALTTAEALAESARLQLQFATVVSPDAGIVSARLVQPGQVLPAGSEMLRLIRRGRLEWRAEATEQELARVLEGADVEIAGPNGPVTGKVRAVAPMLSAKSRTGLVYADLPATPGLRAGTYVRGSIFTGPTSALLVPNDAVVIRDGYAYVFVTEALPNKGSTEAMAKVRSRRVNLGPRQGDRRHVSSGLEATQSVVVTGAGFLHDGDVVRVVRQ